MSTRSFVARGLTASEKGKRLEFDHPVLRTAQFGEISDVKYDPINHQTLVTLTTHVALDDLVPVIIHE